ncbi:Asp-tRNA(Asn)/Glu-tRNA(Gln) amidotransferase A subunit family amidase [Virgibacillus natechei]|uniref:Asp-tRNA(Asn)/Glu-tRNA(Gln) amidotransferase A subunit family amidase n=1 Tax=Virgibacillus natechei TaxID=1216297 RepID=A0ABS4IF11_9BACI|nr:amidase [Virgibacillus natechei]MBP1969522.1 Asp-tRNA(Asn)/Glu-tRNA(Gln) amidotransferase A subunit family amidase [Virgibacillus natechei]UZD11776.1 amidase [Virgibacillus natechei]
MGVLKISEFILNMDATSIAKAIQNGEITSLEAVTTYIEQIKKINPSINALVEDRFAEALTEANVVDNNENIENKPLYGVPISVKESFHVANMKTTGGLEHRQDLIARNDAEVVSLLKEAGAIILGKTNTPALCFCQETENKLYGRTNNPWDPTRTAGGSSGGEGALLSAGGSALGIGSDIGGSIRFPSHFNGVIGFKPGMDQVSAVGHFPAIYHPLQKRMLAMGPMGKSVQDMELMYRIIANNTMSTLTLQDFKIEILPGNTNYPLSESTKEILDQIENFLTVSHSTTRRVPPFFEDSALLWQEIMSIQGSKLVQNEAFNNDRSNVLKAYLKEKLTQRTTIHPYLSWALLGSKLFKPSKNRVKEIETVIHNGDTDLATYLDKRLLIFPVYHSGALHHGKVYKEIFSIRKTVLAYMPYVAYANVWGLPSLTIPVGTDENNMPISIQVMSAIGNEDALFQLGKILEKKFGGYIQSDPVHSLQFV